MAQAPESQSPAGQRPDMKEENQAQDVGAAPPANPQKEKAPVQRKQAADNDLKDDMEFQTDKNIKIIEVCFFVFLVSDLGSLFPLFNQTFRAVFSLLTIWVSTMSSCAVFTTTGSRNPPQSSKEELCLFYKATIRSRKRRVERGKLPRFV